jgi:hypothetical protein
MTKRDLEVSIACGGELTLRGGKGARIARCNSVIGLSRLLGSIGLLPFLRCRRLISEILESEGRPQSMMALAATFLRMGIHWWWDSGVEDRWDSSSLKSADCDSG